jgi:ATP-binding cassette subfamily F protein 3
LLRIIAGTEPIEGERTEGFNVNMAFFAQHQLEALNVNNEMLEELKQAGSAKTEMELRGVLGCFLFSNDDVFKKIKVLSGGEKSRVALAKTLISESNFLLLDEPTNHLDIQSVNILMQALEQYEGTFVTVSHDRHFVKNVANKIWYIEEHELKEYPGTYDEYNYWRALKDKESKEANVKASPVKKKEEPRLMEPSADKEMQRSLKNAQQKLAKYEQKIMELELKKNSLEEELAKPSVYENARLLADTKAQYDQTTSDLNKEQKNWDMAADEIEGLEKGVLSK